MKKQSFGRRLIALISALVMAAVMFVIPASAAEATGWTAPTVKMDIDEKAITAGAHRAAQIAPEILGLNNVATHQLGGSINATSAPTDTVDLAKAKSNALLGMFGTNANDNPNPYLWNYFYNCYAASEGKELSNDAIYLMVAMASPSNADVTAYDWPDGESISVTLKRRPDILLGTGGSTTYESVISTMKENTDSDTTNDYSPALVAYNLATTYDMAGSIMDMANAAKDIMAADSTRTTRYGDPVEIAKDYEEYIKGISLYIMSELEKGTVEKKTIAVITSTHEDGWFRAYTFYSVDGTAQSNRQAEYLYYTTDNIVDKYADDETMCKIVEIENRGKTEQAYYLSPEAVMEADYVIFGGQSASTDTEQASSTEAAFKTVMTDEFGFESSDIPTIFSALPSCVYGITMNSTENAIGYGFFNGFVYPELLNQSYAVAYFYENLFHISDQAALATAIDQNLKNASLASGTTTDLSAYTERSVEEKILQGLEYYNDNEAELNDTYLKPLEGTTYDLTSSIGSGITNSGTTVNENVDSKDAIVSAEVTEKTLDGIEETIISNFTDEEKETYDAGAEFDIDIDLTPVNAEEIDKDVLNKINAAIKSNEKIGAYINIDITYTLGDNAPVTVTDLGNNEIEITIELSKDLQGKDSYVVYREHEGEVTAITPTLSSDGKYLTFKSSKFSTYAIAYTEKVTEKAEDVIADTADATVISAAVCVGAMSVAGVLVVGKKRRELED